MPQAKARDPIYRGRRFEGEIIELCVRWYITYRLSYRDLVAMMAERGLNLSHKATLGPSLSLEMRYLIHWHGSSGMPPMHQNPDKSLVFVRGTAMIAGTPLNQASPAAEQ
jgi:hypothetical protein